MNRKDFKFAAPSMALYPPLVDIVVSQLRFWDRNIVDYNTIGTS